VQLRARQRPDPTQQPWNTLEGEDENEQSCTAFCPETRQTLRFNLR